jgi:hypothetical protein
MTEQLGAVAAARDRLTARARDPRLVLLPGLADDLMSIGAALASLESTARALARIFLSKHYGYTLSTPEYQFLATIAGDDVGVGT